MTTLTMDLEFCVTELAYKMCQSCMGLIIKEHKSKNKGKQLNQ
jgi:hypothetical protein